MFNAAGKTYKNTAQLMAETISEYKSEWLYGRQMPIFRDIHGRRVLHLRELFPCFDVYDRMYENRYYHWHFIEHEGGVTMVYTSDDSDKVIILENISRANVGRNQLNHDVFEELVRSGLIRDEG